MALVLDVSRWHQWCLRGGLLAEVATFAAAAILPDPGEPLANSAVFAFILCIPTCILAFAKRQD